jgi:hypothetical protein
MVQMGVFFHSFWGNQAHWKGGGFKGSRILRRFILAFSPGEYSGKTKTALFLPKNAPKNGKTPIQISLNRGFRKTI